VLLLAQCDGAAERRRTGRAARPLAERFIAIVSKVRAGVASRGWSWRACVRGSTEYLAAFAACGRGESDDFRVLLRYYGVPLVLSTDEAALALVT
jgi:hypothetical protein